MSATTREPSGYQCPFCKLANGEDTAHPCQGDIVRRTPDAMALISPRWWPRNQGHVLVVPLSHYENIYDLPTKPGHAVHDLVREVAIAIRQTYGCQGVSTRQHNEPAGNQDAWHYHVHVFPRVPGRSALCFGALARLRYGRATRAVRRPAPQLLRRSPVKLAGPRVQGGIRSRCARRRRR
jgi:histidine triad (HIT) family protein